MDKFKEIQEQIFQLSKIVNEIDRKLNNLETTIHKSKKSITNSMILLNNKGGESYNDIQKRMFCTKYVNADLTIIQNKILFILEEFKNFCKENDAVFWLHAGTLIGAVRNNELISWDDDADIGMFDCDFEKLKKITKCYKSDWEFVENFYDLDFAKCIQLKYKNCPIIIDVAVFHKVTSTLSAEELLNIYRHIRVEMNCEFHSKFSGLKMLPTEFWHCGQYRSSDKIKLDDLIAKYSKKLLDKIEKKGGKTYTYLGLENFNFPYPFIKDFSLCEIILNKKKMLAPCDYKLYLSGYGDIFDVPSDIGKLPHSYFYKNKMDLIKC